LSDQAATLTNDDVYGKAWQQVVPPYSKAGWSSLGTGDTHCRSTITLLGKQALVKGLSLMVKVMATLIAKLTAKFSYIILTDCERCLNPNSQPAGDYADEAVALGDHNPTTCYEPLGQTRSVISLA
jgi:hypothetical protein